MKIMSRQTVWAALLWMLPVAAAAQSHGDAGRREWRAATAVELQAALPVRAPVVTEHIETEMRTATGVIGPHGKMVAAVVLITAGYAANGKYSYYLLAQAPLRLGSDVALAPGAYVIGWTRVSDGLAVHVYDAQTGAERGTIVARPPAQPLPVVSVKIWPPAEHSVLQIGRFALPYSLGE